MNKAAIVAKIVESINHLGASTTETPPQIKETVRNLPPTPAINQQQEINRLQTRNDNQYALINKLQAAVRDLQTCHSNQAETIRAAQKKEDDLTPKLEALDVIVPALLKGTLKQHLEILSLKGEVEGWKESAASFSRGCDFYHGLIIQCGKAIGAPAFLCDDGSYSEDVLALKVPELVEGLMEKMNKPTLFRRLFGTVSVH